jgi:RNA polymerase-binding transcription factor DksA
METSDFQKILIDRKAEIDRRLDRIDRDFRNTRSADSEERATETENDEVLEGFGRASQAELQAIETALDRIRRGTYGKCVQCGQPISEARLTAVPYATRCEDCVHGDS